MQTGRRTLAKRLVPWLACAAAPSIALAAAGPSFEDRCQQLAEGSTISVTFQDQPVTRDNSRTIAELRRLSQSRSGPYHTVLGLTHAEASASVAVTGRTVTDADGRTCLAPSVRLALGFSELKVYLAAELTDPCRRRIVEEHEAEHVRIWRNHFRVGARLAETLLRRDLVFPLHAADESTAREQAHQQVQAAAASILEQLMQTAMAAHREIDTPMSYQESANRLRACPR